MPATIWPISIFQSQVDFLSGMRFSIDAAWLGALLAVALVVTPPPAGATTEGELRAAVIYNIARFVQWPPGLQVSAHPIINSAANAASPAVAQDGSFAICTIGNSPTADALIALDGKSLNGFTVATRAIRRDRDLAACHVLYIAPDEAVRMTAIAEILAHRHEATLTVSDAPSFLALGGMVQLVVVEDRQRFRINQELAEKSSLSINAKLLQLALPERD